MKFLLPLVLFVFLISCQKGIEDINNPLRTTQNDSVVFSQLVELDSTVGTKPDTVAKGLFFYDNLKRLTVSENYEYTNGVINPLDSKTVLYYNSTDTLPYKQIFCTTDFNGQPDTTTIYYNFVNGRLHSDSTINRLGLSTSVEIDKYSYYTDRIVDTFWQYSTNPTQLSKGYEIITFQKVNGLIISQRDSIVFNYDTPAFSQVSTATHTFSYDNHPNPFNRLKPLYPFYDTEGFSTFIGFEKNNFIESNQSFVSSFWGNSSHHYKNVYQYNSNGYPAVAIVTDQDNPSVVHKFLYFYTK